MVGAQGLEPWALLRVKYVRWLFRGVRGQSQCERLRNEISSLARLDEHAAQQRTKAKPAGVSEPIPYVIPYMDSEVPPQPSRTACGRHDTSEWYATRKNYAGGR